MLRYETVPKPSTISDAITDVNSGTSTANSSEPKSGVSGTSPGGSDTPDPAMPGDPALSEACDVARAAAGEILSRFSPALERLQRLRILTAFRRTLFAAQQPGRRRSERITEAHRDWKSGVHGLALYQKHIARFGQMSRWRRKVEIRKLLDAIHSRERRARARTKQHAAGSEDGALNPR